MNAPRHLLIVEDSSDDAETMVRALRQGGCELTCERVETAQTMLAALGREKWDLVIADYSMPRFDGLAALKLLQEQGLDIPFILVSGTVGEEVAVQAMKAGAHDYVLKGNLARLPLAVERALRDREVRGARQHAENLYRNLVESVPVGLFITSPEGSIVEANPALIEMLGFSDAESLKRANVSDLWLRPEELARIRVILGREGVVQNFEMEMRRPDGRVLWCEQTARAVYDAASCC